MIPLVFLFLTDDKSTLLVTFQVSNFKRGTTMLRFRNAVSDPPSSYHGDTDFSDPINAIMMEKLTSFPTTPKLVVTPTWNAHPSKELAEIRECLHVEYEGGERALGTILEVLSKRWQTLDLISIMKEAQRTLPKHGWRTKITKITDNLSVIPRFQPTPGQS